MEGAYYAWTLEELEGAADAGSEASFFGTFYALAVYTAISPATSTPKGRRSSPAGRWIWQRATSNMPYVSWRRCRGRVMNKLLAVRNRRKA